MATNDKLTGVLNVIRAELACGELGRADDMLCQLLAALDSTDTVEDALNSMPTE
jgi:hypothetical protein